MCQNLPRVTQQVCDRTTQGLKDSGSLGLSGVSSLPALELNCQHTESFYEIYTSTSKA